VQGLVFRTIYSCKNAEYQFQAEAFGKVTPLYPGEIEKAGALNAMANVTTRTWQYWTMRLAKSGNGLAPLNNPAKRIKGKRKKTKGRKR
jgi:hypothetical protein